MILFYYWRKKCVSVWFMQREREYGDTSVPPHDDSRITHTGRQLERRAWALFDDVAKERYLKFLTLFFHHCPKNHFFIWMFFCFICLYFWLLMTTQLNLGPSNSDLVVLLLLLLSKTRFVKGFFADIAFFAVIAFFP